MLASYFPVVGNSIVTPFHYKFDLSICCGRRLNRWEAAFGGGGEELRTSNVSLGGIWKHNDNAERFLAFMCRNNAINQCLIIRRG